ncbi:MAG TPA: hypothetical protein VJQ77_00425 [Novosphingobium sp.]|nr:hypothetical protein [Novosphingobium sp.]
MNASKIGPTIPFRRNRFGQFTGSLIFDRQRDEIVRKHAEKGDAMKIWSGGHFRKN